MNLILVTIDCLRADRLGCLGYPKKITPNLDDLANGGVLFTQAISVGSWTATSFISLFTSTYPFMYGGQLYITLLRNTLAQVLKEAGYHTAGFHPNPLLSSYNGYHKGFDTFDDNITNQKSSKSLMRKPKELVKRIIGTKGYLYEFAARIYLAMAGNPYTSAEALNSKAVRWLSSQRGRFFLWLHYMDCHVPYLLPSKSISPLERYSILRLQSKAHNSPGGLSPQELNKFVALYDAKISYVDEAIGSFLNMLKQMNIMDNTFVIMTADHGEQFKEHGDTGHGVHLYDELLHVPLIIDGPGLENQVINQQVSLLDLAPTILDILGIKKPKTFLGRSLLPLMKGKGDFGNLPVFSEDANTQRDFNGMKPKIDSSQGKKISLRTGKYKYIYTQGNQDELYDLENDPQETHNIISVEPETAMELRTKIMAHIEFEGKSMSVEKERIKTKIRMLKGGGKLGLA